MTNRIDSDWADGEILYAADLNDTFTPVDTISRPASIYTGTDYDSTVATITTNSNNHTLSIGAGAIQAVVLIKVTYKAYAYAERSGLGSNTSVVDLKIETSELSAGSWTSRFDENVAKATATSNSTSTGSDTDNNVQTVDLYYTPTAGEKTNGLDIRFTSTSTSSGTAAGSSLSASFENIQTVLLYN